MYVLEIKNNSRSALHRLNKDKFLCDDSGSITYVDYSLSHTNVVLNEIIEAVTAEVEVQVTFNPLSSGESYPVFEQDFFLHLWLSLSAYIEYPM